MACDYYFDTGAIVYIKLCIKTKTLSVYKPVSACSGNASVFYQF